MSESRISEASAISYAAAGASVVDPFCADTDAAQNTLQLRALTHVRAIEPPNRYRALKIVVLSAQRRCLAIHKDKALRATNVKIFAVITHSRLQAPWSSFPRISLRTEGIAAAPQSR